MTKAQLYPVLKTYLNPENVPKLLPYVREQLAKNFNLETLSTQLDSALRVHVYDRMPIRLLELPGMQLVERDAIFNHIKKDLAHIANEDCLAMMIYEIWSLADYGSNSKQSHLKNDIHQDLAAGTQRQEEEEEDMRQDPVNSIFEFLFSVYARYAILSHTWFQGDHAEIVYEDTLESAWQKNRENHYELAETRAGYAKLKSFCDTAYKSYNTSLAWMDTICINKNSSSELDESIRSMYKWYQQSFVCIAYLHDTVNNDTLQTSTSIADKWFTRGWTLQELLAPKCVQFYNRDWKPIAGSVNQQVNNKVIRQPTNDKENSVIQQLITKLTGIGRTDLLSFDPMQTESSINERMRWATMRTTTRGEDRAYSLMGIFGVNLSIAYGEGAESAFFRLVEKIITTRDTSQVIQLLAWAGRSLSDNIHPTRIIPSSPDNFSTMLTQEGSTSATSINEACSIFPRTGEAIVLTHLGLKVRLLLARVYLPELSNTGTSKRHHDGKDVPTGPWQVTLHYRPLDFNTMKHSDKVETVALNDMHSRRLKSYDFSSIIQTRPPVSHRIVLGIFTFTEDDVYIHIPNSYCAYLLAIPASEMGKDSSIEPLSPRQFQPKWKINTQEIVHISTHASKPIKVEKSAHRDIIKVLSVSL